MKEVIEHIYTTANSICGYDENSKDGKLIWSLTLDEVSRMRARLAKLEATILTREEIDALDDCINTRSDEGFETYIAREALEKIKSALEAWKAGKDE